MSSREEGTVNGTISQYVEAGSTGHAQLVVVRKYNGWYEREAGKLSVRALSRGWRAPDNQGTTSGDSGTPRLCNNFVNMDQHLEQLGGI
jgi:hypothetical protein